MSAQCTARCTRDAGHTGHHTDRLNQRYVSVWLDPVGGQAELVEQACDWKNGIAEQNVDHRSFHFGHLCPYEVCAALLRGEPDPRRAASKALVRTCCGLHNRNCEPPSELCCQYCTEQHHGLHADVPGGPTLASHHDGSICIAPDLSGSGRPRRGADGHGLSALCIVDGCDADHGPVQS